MRLFKGARQIGILVAACTLSATAAPADGAPASTARWSKPVLTVAVTDEAAWSGTNVQGALDQWSEAYAMVLVDGPGADITLEVGNATDVARRESMESVAATSTQTVEGGRIVHCRVGVAVESVGEDVTPLLAHELGHCLGLGHTSGVAGGSVMHWFARDYQGGWSDTVTAADIDKVRSMYR